MWTVDIEGLTYKILRWTHDEQQRYVEDLKKWADIKDNTEITRVYESFLAEQLQKTVEEVRKLDALAYVRLAGEIVEKNVTQIVPKVPGVPSSTPSSSTTSPA